MRPIRAALISVLLGPLCQTVSAAAPTVSSVEAALPGISVRAVNPVPAIPGLYEVIDSEGSFIYVDAELKVAIVGELYDVAERRNLSKESIARLDVVDFDALPLDLAIKRVKGSGQRRMAVFADPDCPYCARLEETLQSVDDVTIYTFMYPVDSLHPSASLHANAIWCSADRDLAWREWLVEHRAPAPAGAGCAAPLPQIAEAAGKFRVQGTPSLVFGSGLVVYGAQSAGTINRYLDEPRLAQQAPTGTLDVARGSAAAR